MNPDARVRRRLHRVASEEADLAGRAARGDRAAFDALFDRYCARMAHAFRALPDADAKAKLWEALEQVFASLACDVPPLVVRAFRVAQASHPGRTCAVVRPRASRRSVSRSDR